MRRGLRNLGGLALLALLFFCSLVAIGLIEAKSEPVRREIRITLPAFPHDQAPYRVALLSDIHFGNRAMQRSRLDAIVAKVNAASPDLIVIVGDFVNGHDGHLESDTHELAASLAALRARDGVIATPGNHDHWTDLERVKSALESTGIAFLANQAVRRGPLVVLGVDDGFTQHDDIAVTVASARDQGGAPIAVSHSPDIAARLPSEVSVLLAGHTHCGQVVLPLVGSLAPVFGYHVYNPRYQCGVVKDPARTIVVTGGLGSGSIPLRVGAPPDWWLVTITGN